MSELDELRKTKAYWIKKYNEYALSLCDAVLEFGNPDTMGDPASIARHNMVAKSVTDGKVKITATYKTGNFVPTLKDFCTTRRLIVKDGVHDAAYLTLTDDPDNIDGKYDFFVPGDWMFYAEQIILNAKKHKEWLYAKKEAEEVENLKKQLLIGVAGFDNAYEKKEGE